MWNQAIAPAAIGKTPHDTQLRGTLVASHHDHTMAPVHIVLDFDGTITARDTIGALGDAAVALQTQTQTQTQTTPGLDDGPDPDWPAVWHKIVADYGACYASHVAAYTPAAAARTALDEELQFLRGLRAVDHGSVQAVQASGLFGIAPHRLHEAGRALAADQTIRLRPGFAGFRAAHTGPMSVVTVNWSSHWVRGVAGLGDDVPVVGNQTHADGTIAPTHPWPAGHEMHGQQRPAATCADKLVGLHQALAVACQTEPGLAFVYVGDSTTDLECLLHAATHGAGGLVMADGDTAASTLLQTLARLGYVVPHVGDCSPGSFAVKVPDDDTPRLAWARDFAEITAARILQDH